MDEIIDISSSPEPQPPPRNPQRTQAKSQRQPNRMKIYDEVIDISDSDDDVPLARKTSSSKNNIRENSGLQAGPSRSGPSRTPSSPQSGSPSNATGGPSTSSNSTKHRAGPLFLLSDDEDGSEAPQHVTLARADEDLPMAVHSSRAPTPEPALDPIDVYIVRVLEVVPDVQPAHVRTLLERHINTHKDGLVELVLHMLFEDSNYPKVDKKGKRKREEGMEADSQGSERGKAKIKVDYGAKDRPNMGGVFYLDIALEQLLLDFSLIPKAHIRKTLLANNGLYAPTYLHLAEEQNRYPLPYHRKVSASRVTGKKKAEHDDEFERERAWLLMKLQEDVEMADAQVAEEMNEQEYEDSGNGIECGCCFSTYPFDKMIQCPDCHLFCSTCMTSYAENLLGAHDPKINCMDQSGCKVPFPESELRRFLSPKLLALYERLKQRKEIEEAGLANLEECPFCEYKVVIENEDEKLFRCEGDDCGAVSCRTCKKPDHLPKSCKEMEEDKHLDARHAIEEAMTRALMRNCPKCQKAFVKEHGCNKMMCPNCQTLSCYICRQVIHGYEHFSNPPPYTGGQDPNKCNLWDPVEQRHTDEVRKAALEALEEYKMKHPNMTAEELKAVEVDIPPPMQAPPVAGHMQRMQAPALPLQHHAEARIRALQQHVEAQLGALQQGVEALHAQAHQQNPPPYLGAHQFAVDFQLGMPAAQRPFIPPPPIPHAAPVAVARPRRVGARRR